MIRRHYFHLILLGFAATAFVAAAQQPDDFEPQRVRLQAIRKNPDHFARLRENLNAFTKQTDAKRKDAIVKLDQDIHGLTSVQQERSWRVLERYADWLEQLKKNDEQAYLAIKNARDATARLALIKEARDSEWMRRQPRTNQEHWVKLQGEERSKYVAEQRKEERRKSQHWLIASRFWKELESKQPLPARLSDFAYKSKKGTKDKETGKVKDPVEINRVKQYVEHYLLRQLSPAEVKQLEDAEGRWPDYPMALVQVASQHPNALPMRNVAMKFEELPIPVQQRFDKKGGGAKLAKAKTEIKQFEGPGFAAKFAQITLREDILFSNPPDGNEYMACGYKSLTPPMKLFIDKQLVPALNAADKRKLVDSESKWPEYPQAIQELSSKYYLRPPWHNLPDADKFYWDKYRPEKNAAPDGEMKKEET